MAAARGPRGGLELLSVAPGAGVGMGRAGGPEGCGGVGARREPRRSLRRKGAEKWQRGRGEETSGPGAAEGPTLCGDGSGGAREPGAARGQQGPPEGGGGTGERSRRARPGKAAAERCGRVGREEGPEPGPRIRRGGEAEGPTGPGSALTATTAAALRGAVAAAQRQRARHAQCVTAPTRMRLPPRPASSAALAAVANGNAERRGGNIRQGFARPLRPAPLSHWTAVLPMGRSQAEGRGNTDGHAPFALAPPPPRSPRPLRGAWPNGGAGPPRRGRGLRRAWSRRGRSFGRRGAVARCCRPRGPPRRVGPPGAGERPRPAPPRPGGAAAPSGGPGPAPGTAGPSRAARTATRRHSPPRRTGAAPAYGSPPGRGLSGPRAPGAAMGVAVG